MNKLKSIILVLLLISISSVKVKAQEDADSIQTPAVPSEPEDLQNPAKMYRFDFKGIPGFQLSPEQEKEYLKNIMPKIKKELESIKKLNKMKYFNLLQDLHFKNLDFPLFSKRDKEAIERSKKIGELEVETESLGLKYQNSGKSDKDKMKAELRDKLNELFELRESNRKEEVNELEKRLSELKKTLQERRDNKEEIVKKRMLELMGESKNIEW